MISGYLAGYYANDVTAMDKWGTHKNPLGLLCKNASNNNPFALFYWGEIDYGNSNYLERIWPANGIGSGEGKLAYDNAKGIDALSNRDLVILEGTPECMVERWQITSDVEFTGFMAGGLGDDDELLNNPQDITVGDDDTVYVLDILSTGEPRIKMFDAELNSLGGFGDSTMIPGTPKRIDYDFLYGTLHVLTADDVVVLEP